MRSTVRAKITDREIMQQALGYMESVGQMDMYPEEWAIAVALRERLAQPEQEPLALTFINTRMDGCKHRVTVFPEDFQENRGDLSSILEGQNVVALYTTPPQRKPDHIGDTNKMVPFQDLAAELFVVAQISPADDGFSDTITRIEAWLRNHFSTPPQRKPLPPQSPCEMTQAEGKMFKLGWLECEAAHGIKGGS